jgi:hypothetical protein
MRFPRLSYHNRNVPGLGAPHRVLCDEWDSLLLDAPAFYVEQYSRVEPGPILRYHLW